jgi:cytochrome oxidase Cu insertion factor (SCO1/SenC/PrrC family)
MRTKWALLVIGAGALAAPWMGLSAEPGPQPAGAPAPLAAGPLAHWQGLFPAGLVDAAGKPVDLKALQGKTVGVYFSAHWCPSCVAFTPDLVKFRDRNSSAFEVVFVSFDHSADDQRQYMAAAQMKWPAVACLTEPAKALQRKFAARVIPTLVIMGPDGREITREGRTDLQADPDHALAKWQKAAEGTPLAQAQTGAPQK